jgi:hypothetical protein
MSQDGTRLEQKVALLVLALFLIYLGGYLVLRTEGKPSALASWSRIQIDPPGTKLVKPLRWQGRLGILDAFYFPLREVDQAVTGTRIDFSEGNWAREYRFHIGSTADF